MEKNGYIVKSAKTNSSGWYSIAVEKGSYKIEISKDGYTTKNVDVTLNTSDSKDFSLTPIPTYTVSGKVKNESNSGINGAKIQVKKNGYNVKSVTANSSGNYSVTLEKGDYTFVVSKNGYDTKTISATVNGSNISGKDVTLKLTPTTTQAPKYTISGVVNDADNGNAISGVTVKAKKNSSVVKTATTNASGVYSMTLEKGSYTLEFSRSGYITLTDNIEVKNENLDVRTASLNKEEGQSSDEIRIVLNWGSTPNDLDSHLYFNGGHVYYSSKRASSGNTSVVLDTDDTSAYGPETITITNPGSTTFEYDVYNFSGSPSITASGARVVVYKGNSVVKTYNVPTTGEGRTWNVFTIQNGQIITVNTIS